MFLLTFFSSLKIIVHNDSIVCRGRFFCKTIEKRLDISNANKVLFKGIKFESDTGEFVHNFFVCLEKDGQEIMVHGNSVSNLRSVMKIAKRIGDFLELPVEGMADLGDLAELEE